MNIFILSDDPSEAAKMHNDRHVVKMILESAQMLSTVVRESGIDAGYEPCFRNHPCTQWAGESLSNWKWLRNLALELNKEYMRRFDNDEWHASARVIESLPEPNITDSGLTEPPRAMPDHCKQESVVQSYREYYRTEKEHIAEWSNRKEPEWYGHKTA